ncbi:MAG: tetratricopeptide repeat protein [Chloroflexota bacterium]|jgi:Tfp pilus assembly protein PilF|nr:tetratricopeptide repeat protein [Bacteroidales bacterium]HLO92299.1 tetratricopeptide repeat protein [Lentimicrobium sp.]
MKDRLKTLLLLAIMAISISASAQNDKVWPLSTKSEEAKASFKQAVDRLWNARIDQYREKIAEAVKADPDFFLAHANIALVEFNDDKSKSSENLKKALEISQDNLTGPEKIVRQVLVNLNDNKLDVIKANLDEMVSTYPDAIQSYEFAMGISRNILNDSIAAFNYALKAVEKNPDHGPAWNQLGYYYMSHGDMAKAKDAFNNYLRCSPNEANAHDSFGDFCMKEGKYDEARMHYEQAVSMGMTASRERAEKARTLAQGSGEPDND